MIKNLFLLWKLIVKNFYPFFHKILSLALFLSLWISIHLNKASTHSTVNISWAFSGMKNIQKLKEKLLKQERRRNVSKIASNRMARTKKKWMNFKEVLSRWLPNKKWLMVELRKAYFSLSLLVFQEKLSNKKKTQKMMKNLDRRN